MAFVARAGRIDVRVPIVVGFGGASVTAETRNIGLGGVFVATGEHAIVGQIASLALALPDWDEALMLRGEVRWVRASEDGRHRGVPGIGIKFVKLPLYAAAALDNLVRAHTPER